MDRLALVLNKTLAEILTLGGKCIGTMHKKPATLGYHFCVGSCSWFFGGKC